MSRCTGHCCRRFVVSLDQLTDPSADSRDGDQIRDMLILIEEVNAQFGEWRCTCRHFDGKGCRVYEERPQMCRSYGRDHPCEYEGCTLKMATA